MFKILKLLLGLFLVIISLKSFSQNFKAGKIITLTNDTLVGFIKDRCVLKNSKTCIFKESKNGEVKEYNPADIKGYYISNGKYYSSQEYFDGNKNAPRFFDILVEGKVNLYYYHKYRNLSFFIQKKNDKLIGLSNERVIIGKPVTMRTPYQQEYIVNLRLYRDTLYNALKDCDDIKNLVFTTEYKEKQLINLIRYYNTKTCNEGSCLTYERDLSISKHDYGIYAGLEIANVSFEDHNIDANGLLSQQIAFYYNVPLALISNNFSLQFELLWNTINHSNFANVPGDVENLKIESNKIGLPIFLNYKLRSRNGHYTTVGFGKELSSIYKSKVTYRGEFLRSDGVIDYGDLEKTNHRFLQGGWFFDVSYTHRLSSKLYLYSGIRLQQQNNLILASESDNRLTYKKAGLERESMEYSSNIAAIRIGVGF